MKTIVQVSVAFLRLIAPAFCAAHSQASWLWSKRLHPTGSGLHAGKRCEIVFVSPGRWREPIVDGTTPAVVLATGPCGWLARPVGPEWAGIAPLRFDQNGWGPGRVSYIRAEPPWRSACARFPADRHQEQRA